MNQELEKSIEQQKLRITQIKDKIKNLTEEIQQKKFNISSQLINQTEQNPQNILPSTFYEVQNILIDTIKTGYENIIQEKEKIIQKLQNEINNLIVKFDELKNLQDKQINRITSLSIEKDKSVIDMLKKIADLELENKTLKEKALKYSDINLKEKEFVLEQIKILNLSLKEILRLFRNPLGMINEIFEMIKENEKNLDSNLKKIIIVQKELDKIKEALTYTLEKLNIEQLNIQKINLKSIVLEVVKKLQKNIKEKNITVEYQFDEDIISVEADFKILTTVLEEIILNSIESFENSDLRNKISISLNKKDQNFVLTVKDNSIGIPQHLISKVFNLFFTTKYEKGHFGVGLFISMLFLKIFNAEIKIESEVNKGTITIIEFKN